MGPEAREAEVGTSRGGHMAFILYTPGIAELTGPKAGLQATPT